MKYTYILTVSDEKEYNPDKLKEKIDLAVDWVKIVPNVYLLLSTSDLNKWYSRLKDVLNDNRFFIAPVDIGFKQCSGWLYEKTWNKISEFRHKKDEK